MTAPIRVLMISKASIVGIYQRKLELIARQGVELCVIVPPYWKDRRGEMPLERLYTAGYTLQALPMRFNGRHHLHFYAGLGRHLRGFAPHIVHIDEEPYSLVTWQALWHAKRSRSRALFFSWQNIQRHYPPPFRWGERWVMQNVDYAIMGTESAAQVWRQKGYQGPLAVIPQFGTDPALFQPAPQANPQDAEDGEDGGRPFTIGYIGRLVEEKGVGHLLAALAQVPGDWRLYVVGGGPLLGALQSQAAQSGMAEKTHFTGQIPSTEIPSWYAQLDVLVLPSLTRPNWKEQFGRVLVEAMASAVPVIGSDSGAIPDVIGDAGLVYPEGDSGALAGHITRLCEDHALRARLGQQGRARFLAHFTQEHIAQATVQVYREMLAAGN